ncbi:laccase-7-like [Phalaenopsis equestris]|uniref:laccase-7-like n=1 Tax=Phalaenopsis equestris TaxID=78828 RepID=UPI0009E41A5B|nr:laccase-7-like [Phalaenopsis equestris]
MAGSAFFMACAILVLFGFCVEAELVQHTFKVSNMMVRRYCKNKTITVVNGEYPGPTITAHEGDSLAIQVINESPYNISIHWHGIFQRMTPWADGPNYITQCPITPGNSYTYKFNVVGQEGTLWWHAHVSVLRATVYGALIILPRAGVVGYPFPNPHKEETILLGEWWKADVITLQNRALASGSAFNISDAYTINGHLGDLYRCSNKHTHKLEVEQGKSYLLRIINAALNTQFFFKIAGHRLTVVAADASYTSPFSTDTIAIAPGPTIDALLHADSHPSNYYISALTYASSPAIPFDKAASPYASAPPSASPFDNTTTVAVLSYKSSPPSSSPPIMPPLPAFNDTPTAHHFYSNLTALHPNSVPLQIDQRMFVAFGLGLTPCSVNQPLCRGNAISASMNNISFSFPTTVSMLEAHFRKIRGVYTKDFPNRPLVAFDFSNPSVNNQGSFQLTDKGTKVKKLKYNETVEVVLQNTAVLAAENHPLHLHGYNFYVVAQGFGNYNKKEARKNYNLVNPQERNTIAVPVGGWAVIRFRADNPGLWIMHCHLDGHLSLGLAMVFEVGNGPTPSTTVPPPPQDYPTC